MLKALIQQGAHPRFFGDISHMRRRDVVSTLRRYNFRPKHHKGQLVQRLSCMHIRIQTADLVLPEQCSCINVPTPHNTVRWGGSEDICVCAVKGHLEGTEHVRTYGTHNTSQTQQHSHTCFNMAMVRNNEHKTLQYYSSLGLASL